MVSVSPNAAFVTLTYNVYRIQVISGDVNTISDSSSMRFRRQLGHRRSSINMEKVRPSEDFSWTTRKAVSNCRATAAVISCSGDQSGTNLVRRSRYPPRPWGRQPPFLRASDFPELHQKVAGNRTLKHNATVETFHGLRLDPVILRQLRGEVIHVVDRLLYPSGNQTTTAELYSSRSRCISTRTSTGPILHRRHWESQHYVAGSGLIMSRIR